MVEGWAEEILLPALAKRMKSAGLISRDITEAGVSVVNVGNTAFLHYSRIFIRTGGPEINIPVAIVTDSDIPEYKKKPKINEQGEPEYDERDRMIYDYVPIASNSNEITNAVKKRQEKFNKQMVKAFVAPRWTLEFCLLKSTSFSELFISTLKKIHKQINPNEIEYELAKKLIDGNLEKTEIAHQLAQALLDDNTSLEIDLTDPSCGYLLEAIKYACGH